MAEQSERLPSKKPSRYRSRSHIDNAHCTTIREQAQLLQPDKPTPDSPRALSRYRRHKPSAPGPTSLQSRACPSSAALWVLESGRAATIRSFAINHGSGSAVIDGHEETLDSDARVLDTTRKGSEVESISVKNATPSRFKGIESTSTSLPASSHVAWNRTREHTTSVQYTQGPLHGVDIPHGRSDVGYHLASRSRTRPEKLATSARENDGLVSAAKARRRYVLVECGRVNMRFPVIADTTPTDIVKSAATVLSEPIEVKSALLLEQFQSSHLQRPLRNFEYLRDVLDSWDTDSQNSLVLTSASTIASFWYESHTAPDDRPDDSAWLMQYASKPGKWDTGRVSIRANGQIVITRSSILSHTSENICHLSDFDIYVTSQEKASKSLKIPNRFCFAIKSQQKPSIFESIDKFVHYFSHEDEKTAFAFYAAVRNWRSWYLAHALGKRKCDGDSASNSPELDSNQIAMHRVSYSSHYELGSFEPLIGTLEVGTTTTLDSDNGGIQLPIRSPSQSSTHEMMHRKVTDDSPTGPSPSTKRTLKKVLRMSPTGHNQQQSRVHELSANQDAVTHNFAASGLLGDLYVEKRKQARKKAELSRTPWTLGPSLLNNVVGSGKR